MLNINNKEIWKDIKDFEEMYEISSFGRIKSKERLVQNTLKSVRKVKEKIKSTRIRSETCKYLNVSLSKNNISYVKPVHRLVAQAFHINPENKPMVNHIDGNKLNNNAYNLEWVTCSENHKHAFKIGLRTATRNWLGKKFSSTSKYHNVGWDYNRKKWIASLKFNGKSYTKRFAIEEDAALHVNFLLNKFNITDRPKNIIN